MVCLAPFKRVEINCSGDVYFCCPAWVSNKRIGNIFDASLADIWISTEANLFRRDVLSGKYSYCDEKVCPYKLQQLKNHQANSYNADCASLPSFIAVSYDKTCNLYCRSCRKKPLKRSPNYNKIKHFQDSLIKGGILGELEYLSVAGNGDPFASKLYWSLIQALKELKKKPKLILRTNGLLFHEKNWQRLLPCIDLPLHKLDISIDAATANTYKKLRRGGNFKILFKNISFIKELHDSGKINNLCAMFVVQKDNYREIPEFIELMEKFNFTEIIFKRICNWDVFTQEEFHILDVANPQNPEYPELMRIFDLPIAKRAIVNRFNLF